MNGFMTAGTPVVPTWVLPWLAILLGFAATYASRFFGVLLSGRIVAESRAIEWLTCVTYALLAGLIVRMIVMPLGALDAAAMWMRLTAVAVGLGTFYLFRRAIAWGVLAGTATLVALLWPLA